MSLANENDMIIPNTTGLISALSKEANNQGKGNLAQYISSIPLVYSIVIGRSARIPLQELVNPARISNSTDRIVESKREKKEDSVYEDWFKE